MIMSMENFPSENSTNTTTRWLDVDGLDSEKLKSKYVPENTSSSAKWALSTFTNWMESRNMHYKDAPGQQVPIDILNSTKDTEKFCKWMILFVAEVRRKDGNKYPPKTIYFLLAGLLRHCRAIDNESLNFLNTKDTRFAPLQNAIDIILRDLRQEGVGSTKKSAEIFTKAEETKLWDDGVLSLDNPKSLLRAVFFLNGKNICLRGGAEHRNLKLSQFKRLTNPDRYIYTENCSKNRAGGLGQLHVVNKTVPIYSMPELGPRCHVNVLDTNIEKLPLQAFQPTATSQSQT